VRELQNLIERSVILSAHVLFSGSRPELTYTRQEDSKSRELSGLVALEDAERSHILQTLQETECVAGGRDGAAAQLGLPRTNTDRYDEAAGFIINRGPSSALPLRAAVSVPIS
jgi:transcriptional regulator with PAS, ATPase and Fis domain